MCGEERGVFLCVKSSLRPPAISFHGWGSAGRWGRRGDSCLLDDICPRKYPKDGNIQFHQVFTSLSVVKSWT